jgi:hypothetical protein
MRRMGTNDTAPQSKNNCGRSSNWPMLASAINGVVLEKTITVRKSLGGNHPHYFPAGSRHLSAWISEEK